MKKRSGLAVIFFIALMMPTAKAQHILAPGEQPQLTVDQQNVVRVVYGEQDKIYYSTSTDHAKTFSKPVLIGEVTDMHLGMTRGPQLASSRNYSIITAMDKKGDIHAYRLTHKNGQWEKLKNINDVGRSAPEGLMSLAADDKNHFYAVWLDLRENRQNNIWFSTFNGQGEWSKNAFAYRSEESHVCECCKPSVAVRNNQVAIMFRNWLKGSRDLYLIRSSDNGKSFTDGQKLGNGTWQLKGCPMDGGGIAIDAENKVHTAWQREGQVFYAQPGGQEMMVGQGRSVGMSGNLIYWEKGSDLVVKRFHGEEQRIGQGTALKLYEFQDQTILAVWEKDDQILFKTLTF